MADKIKTNWTKESTPPRSFSFQISAKLSGKLKRKGIWSPEGSGAIGNRKLQFRSKGKANMHVTIYDSSSEQELGHLDFYWKDFQCSKLEFASGSIFHFKSFDLFRGAWSWLKQDSPHEQFIFRVDNPLHRSGAIEYNSKDISAEERDVLMLLGLHLSHYINTWLITIIVVIVGVITGK
ncbi:MAG: hypothetical protein L3J79_03765 [Candidatus Marinimicrobia bacterium]|nr:hypothetical protein [Candidatus Neomarinimicrobiota bacterium]